MQRAPSELIAEFYAAFASPAPTEIEGCPCCTDPAGLRKLVDVPLRELTAADLEQYGFSVLTTVEGSDLRYFWPRLVELSMSGELEVDPEVLFDKPRHAEWRTAWTQRQQQLMERLAAAVIGSLAAGDTDPFDVDRWVCAMGRFVDDITSYLDPLLAPDANAATTLREWYDFNAPRVARDGLANPFWGHHPNGDRLREWFERPDIVAIATRGPKRP